ncbi:hypothetical protein GCM10027514_38790 [Azotobacter armeniacus]
MIQVTSDKASLTKPRVKLIKLETAAIAMIAQSIQVNTMVQPMNEKALHSSRAPLIGVITQVHWPVLEYTHSGFKAPQARLAKPSAQPRSG